MDIPLNPMANRLRVFIFVSYYLPGYKAGGPARTIANMVERLGDQIDFRIACMDRDLGDTGSYSGVRMGEWNMVGKARVFYLTPKHRSWREIQGLLRGTSYDVLYLNSFFDFRFTIVPLMLRAAHRFPRKPIILAPRGEFSSGALLIKRWKKRSFMFVTRLIGLYSGVIWHASSIYERDDIHRVFPSVSIDTIKVALDLAPAEGVEAQVRRRVPVPARGEVLCVCFLSRLSPKKNLDYALRCLRSVNKSVEFTIYGPQEDAAYWAQCEALIASLPSNVKVYYAGTVEHNQVEIKLAGHDLFFFPTRGENYGHVIYEALAAGLPILISDQTPWHDLQQRGVGWVLPLDHPEEFARVIDEVAAMRPEERNLMRKKAQAYALEKSEDASVLQANRALFMDVLNGA